MLRPKQLVPICSGARTWLVAGSYGRNNSVDGTDDKKCNDQRVSKAAKGTSSRPSIHASWQSTKTQWTSPNKVNDTGVHQGTSLHGHSVASHALRESSSRGHDTAPRMDISDAAFGKLRSENSSISQSKEDLDSSNVVKEAHQLSYEHDDLHTVQQHSNMSVEKICHENCLEKENRNQHTVNILKHRVQQVADSGYLDTKAPEGLTTVPATAMSLDSRKVEPLPGWTTRSNQDATSDLQGAHNSTVSESLASLSLYDLKNNTTCHETSIEVPDDMGCNYSCITKEVRTRGRHSYEDGPEKRLSGNKKMYAHQANRGKHGQPRASTGKLDRTHELINDTCRILDEMSWDPDALEALASLGTVLSAYQINEVLKHQKDPKLALQFFKWAKRQQGFKHDVHTYTTMLGILGRARNFEELTSLMQAMFKEGCSPNIVTYNRLIHCYGRANYLETSLKIFDHMQAVGCSPDRVTYGTLIDLQAKAGFHEVAMDLYNQMQEAGYPPDTFTYSIIIHCLGKAGKLSEAYRVFSEMTQRGHLPSVVTYNIIIDLHAKAGKFDMAMKLYNDMQDAGFHPDKVTYGIIMEVLGYSGHIEEAENVFGDMERAGWSPDALIYGLMVDLWGKVGNPHKAIAWFNRMLQSGIKANAPSCNSLVSAYLRANMFEGAGIMLREMKKWGLSPTLQTYTLLLASFTGCEDRHQLQFLMWLMGNTGHSAHSLLGSLLTPNLTGEIAKSQIMCFFSTMQYEELESRRGFADSLIDFLHKSGRKSVAGYVWEVASEQNLYPYAIKQRTPNYWSLNLHVMSIGTALVAMMKTLASFRQTVLVKGEPPDRIDIITGWGRRSRVTGSSLVKQAVEDCLQALGSPFFIEDSNIGCFVGQGPSLVEWLKQPRVGEILLSY